MKKKLFSMILVSVMLLSFAACNNGNTEVTGSGTETTYEETSGITDIEESGSDTDTETETDAETAPPETEPEETKEIIDEEPVFYEPKSKDKVDVKKLDFSSLAWDENIKNANSLANGVQGRFTDGERSEFMISNLNMSLAYHILQNDTMIVKSLTNSKGVPYFENSMDAYIRIGEDYYLASESLYSGRMNSQRMGYYYYDFRLRDQNFINPDTKKVYTEGEDCLDLIKEYSDQIKGSDVRDIKIEDGVLSYTVSTLIEPNIQIKGLNVSIEEFDALQITVNAEASDYLSVFLLTKGAGTYSPDRQLVHRFNKKETKTMVIPFSAMKSISGNITGIKIALGTASKEKIVISELKLLKRGGENLPLLLDRSYHTYPDKLHEELRVVATGTYSGGGYLGTKIEIPASTVRKMILKGDGEEYTGIPAGFDFSKLEYVGFDVKDAGVFGIIMPGKQNGTVKVELRDSNYIITREIKLSDKLTEYGSNELYHRIYTSDSHQFNDLRKEAYIERNPLTDIQIVSNEYGSRVFPYDRIRGCYDIFTTGAGFVDAYKTEPDKQIKVNIVATGDGVTDRKVYFNVYTSSGALECSAALDNNMLLLPIPVQVSKNFTGEFEEKKYDQGDNSFGGEAYLPLVIGKDESRKLTVLHLYQNWGKNPLKQLSSISFVQPYYHLSIGVTETNCIAPYFVFGKDGWTLPDFRSNSAPLWNSQPQHTSTGKLYFLSYYKETKGKFYMSESQSAEILSSGPIYADVKMDYLSDDGAIKVEYRHTELPQTDENRTLYEIRMNVKEDVTINNFDQNFTIFRFDSRYANARYRKIGYLNENNEQVIEEVDQKRKKSRLVKLGTDYPYVSVFDPNFTVPGSENTGAVNIAFIVKNCDITIGGEKYTGNLIFRENCISSQTHVELSLDLGNVTLKAGDKINIDLILLPWGESKSQNDDNVRNVRQDTCIDPVKLKIKTGVEIKDTYIPMLKAKKNTAEFTVSGGKNKCVVRIYGFTDYKKPDISVMKNGKWEKYVVSGVNGYDGYQVYYDEDGTYSFSFIVDMDAADSYELRLEQK